MSKSDHAVGPMSYVNWQTFKLQDTHFPIYEYPVFTDADLIGKSNDDLGPYEFVNCIDTQNRRIQAPAGFLRAMNCLNLDASPLDSWTTNDKNHHGENFQNEIIALMALTLGLKLKAGVETRIYNSDLNDDPRGLPIADSNNQPIFLNQSTHQAPVVPDYLLQPILVDDLAIITSYPKLDSQDATALLKAARLYQDAMWIADFQPELAWILMTSSIEAAAARLFQDSSFGATKRFRQFLLDNFAPPPPNRPESNEQILWSKSALREMFNRIYDVRSNYLHDGTAIPYPMCLRPRKLGNGFQEKPLGLAQMKGYANWLNKDTPMLLRVFAHITRSSLLKWWKSLVSETKPPRPPDHRD